MFYTLQITNHVRVSPELFNLPKEQAIIKCIKRDYDGVISEDLGIVIDVDEVENIGEGIVIPGDGASYYDTTFSLLTFKPEMHEVVLGKIKDIADFGVFMSIGPIEGMIHVSQTMDDFVSFSKDKVLLGKESKQSLKVGDKCRARIIATSYKDPLNPKIGLTMRQQKLGRFDLIEEAPKEEKKEEKPAKKTTKKK